MSEYKRIYLDKQNFIQNKAEQFDYTFINSSLHEYVSTKSFMVNQFEVQLSDYFDINRNNIIVTNSGTSALHLVFETCDFSYNSNIILPITTFISTANAIRYCGCYRLYFVDINEKTWCIDINKIFDNNHNLELKKETLDGIVYVDLYGNIANINDILEDKYLRKPKIIVDASHSFGMFPDKSRLNKVDFFTYSFNGNKIITTGAGGLVVVGTRFDEKNVYNIRLTSNQARDENGEYIYIGYNYRMAGINAALGLMQLQYLDFFINRKNRINEIYRNELKDIVKFQEPEPYVKPVWWMTACLFDKGIDIEDLMERLNKYNIETRRIFKPLNQYKPYHSIQRFPVAEMIYDRGLCLPSSTVNTDEDIFFVCKTIKEILGEIK